MRTRQGAYSYGPSDKNYVFAVVNEETAERQSAELEANGSPLLLSHFEWMNRSSLQGGA